MSVRRVGIALKPNKPEAGPVVQELIAWLRQRDREVLLDPEAAAACPSCGPARPSWVPAPLERRTVRLPPRRPAATAPKEAGHYRGIRSVARTPRSSGRFSSVSEPPCPSAICRLKTSPIPEPPAFVVKKGTNRLPVFCNPGP